MPEIILGQRKPGTRNVALVDEQDADLLEKSWHLMTSTKNNKQYCRVCTARHITGPPHRVHRESLHRIVASRIWPDYYEYRLGFANGNPRDCRRSNIVRLCRLSRYREGPPLHCPSPSGPEAPLLGP